MQDLRYAIRILMKHPGSTVLAVLILALGIGGNTAVFSVVDKAILDPIPGRETDKLVTLREVEILHQAHWNVSPRLFIELSTHTNIFASLSAYFAGPETLTLERGANAVKLRGARTTPGFFETVGAGPLTGRAFLPDEGRPGNDSVLVASYGCWQQNFGGDPKFVGSTITLSGHAYTVVGIMPPNFQFPFNPGENQFWIPHVFTAEETTNPDFNINRTWSVIGRLQDAAPLEQARALLDIVAHRREKDRPETNRKWIIEAKPARTMFVGPTLERTLWSLQASVLMLLLISCANVGTLLVSRAAARRGEFSIRLAIGAGRLRVVRQLITESLVLAAVAGLVGVFFAWGGIRALEHFYLGHLPRMRVVGVDGSVLALTVFVSTLTGLLFGVAPAWLVSRLRLSDSLKDASQQQSRSFVQRLFQDGLVVLQVSLAVVLLVGAALMIQSTVRLLHVDPGLDPIGLFRVFYESFPRLTYTDFAAAEKRGLSRREAKLELYRAEIKSQLMWQESMIERLHSIPGILNVSIKDTGVRFDFQVQGRDELVRLEWNLVGLRAGDSFFHTLHVPRVTGRLLTAEDAVPGQRTVVINRELARRCWPGEDAVGKRLTEPESPVDTPRTLVVVGVVENILDSQRDADPRPALYEPIERIADSGRWANVQFMVRSNMDPDLLRRALNQVAKEMMPSLDILHFDSVEAQLYASTAPRRIFTWLLNTMAALGLLLSALGVYAVMAYGVVQRTREIGLRMALGATRGDIARLIVGRGGRLVLSGMVLGVVAAFTLAHHIENLLYQVEPGDPWAFVGVLLVLGTVAGIACYIPARRAARIDPMVALRFE